MGSFHLTKKNQYLKKKKMNIPFNLLVISYLLICIISLLSSPTTASFNDTQTIEGKITAGNTFEESEEQEDMNDPKNEAEEQSETSGSNQMEDEIADPVEEEKDNQDMKEDQMATNGSDQVEKETADTVEQNQDNRDTKEDQQSGVVAPESKMDEDENANK